jgi:hypothetical protein
MVEIPSIYACCKVLHNLCSKKNIDKARTQSAVAW